MFDYSLNQTLAQPRKIRTTIDRVRSAVARWVRAEIPGAVQTPMYLGDPDLNFFVPGTKLPALSSVAPSDRERECVNELKKEYERRDAQEKREPYKFAPAAWRHYQERFFRPSGSTAPDVGTTP